MARIRRQRLEEWHIRSTRPRCLLERWSLPLMDAPWRRLVSMTPATGRDGPSWPKRAWRLNKAARICPTWSILPPTGSSATRTAGVGICHQTSTPEASDVPADPTERPRPGLARKLRPNVDVSIKVSARARIEISVARTGRSDALKTPRIVFRGVSSANDALWRWQAFQDLTWL